MALGVVARPLLPRPRAVTEAGPRLVWPFPLPGLVKQRSGLQLPGHLSVSPMLLGEASSRRGENTLATLESTTVEGGK